MTDEKRQFAEQSKAEFIRRFDEKFLKGDQEHGDDFFSLDLLEEALWENIDQFTYLYGEMVRHRNEYQRGYAQGFKDATLMQSDDERRAQLTRAISLAMQEGKGD